MISKQDVQHIAKLARLELSEKEITKMQEELANILDYVEMLNELDVSGTTATSHSIPVENVMRGDIPESPGPEAVQGIKEQFPDREGDLLKVKGVL